jgi:hypothetical protein
VLHCGHPMPLMFYDSSRPSPAFRRMLVPGVRHSAPEKRGFATGRSSPDAGFRLIAADFV